MLLLFVVVRPSRSDEDHFSHPGVEGAGLICEYAGGWKGQSVSGRFSGSVDRGWQPHVVPHVQSTIGLKDNHFIQDDINKLQEWEDWTMWVFEERYMRGTFSRFGYKYQY